jgi:signal transduction histidine kinase
LLLTLTLEGTLALVRTHGFAPGYLDQLSPLPLSAAHPAAEAARTGQPVWLHSQAEFAARYPEAGLIRQPYGFQGSAVVPLQFEARVLGVLTVSFLSEQTFPAEDQALLLAMAGAGAQALERARLFAEAQRLNAELEARVQDRTQELQAAVEELRASRQQLVEEVAARLRAQRQLEQWREAERVRIAREVHDELGGALTGLKMGLTRLRRTAELPPAAQAQAAELAAEIDATTQITRRIAQELRPALLDDFGLLAALDWQFKEFLGRSGLAGNFACEVSELSLPPEASIACFRIFQEALTNVARHAQASRVDVSIRLAGGRILLQVADDGRGLPPGDQAAHGHLGLVGMRERAALLGGELQLVSAPGQGTQVILRVPNMPTANAGQH